MNLASRVVLLATLLVLPSCQLVGRDPFFRLTLHVVDDEGAPVAQAESRIGAERRPKGEESGGKGIFVEGVTDEHGYFSGEMEAWNASQAGYLVQKKGYYGVWMTYRAKDPVQGKWQPWNPGHPCEVNRLILLIGDHIPHGLPGPPCGAFEFCKPSPKIDGTQMQLE